jgi:hypothetical protein
MSLPDAAWAPSRLACIPNPGFARPPEDKNAMDALLPLFIAIAVLIALDIAAIAFGVDSRDGFTDDRPRSGLV